LVIRGGYFSAQHASRNFLDMLGEEVSRTADTRTTKIRGDFRLMKGSSQRTIPENPGLEI
jgi:hypothetical protein